MAGMRLAGVCRGSLIEPGAAGELETCTARPAAAQRYEEQRARWNGLRTRRNYLHGQVTAQRRAAGSASSDKSKQNGKNKRRAMRVGEEVGDMREPFTDESQ